MSAVAVESTLAYERRMRPRAAAVAALAGLLLIAVIVVQTTGPQAKVSERTLELVVGAKRDTQDIIGAILTAINALAIAGALYFLLGAARRRRPEMVPFIGPLCVAAGVLTAIASIVSTIADVNAAHQFVSSGNQTYQQAKALTSSGVITGFQLAGLLGALLLSLSLILVSLQAMRVGLLTRLMGYAGMVAALNILIPSSIIFIMVEIGWFIALALVLIGRSPNGTPPAWESGQAVPWPSAQEQREQRIRAASAKGANAPARGAGRAGRAGRTGRGQNGRSAAPEPVIEAKPATSKPSPATSKRKRKRKR